MSATRTSQRLLDYAPLRTVRRWKRLVAFLTLAALVAPLCVWAYRSRSWVTKRIAVSRCLSYEAPADRVVHDEDVSRSAKLLAENSHYVKVRHGGSDAAEYDCAPWKVLGLAKECYLCSPVFLHELRSPCGNRRLVAAFIYPGSDAFGWCVLKVPAFGNPEIVWPTTAYSVRYAEFDRTKRSPLRLYAGQLDPNDESHFTIRYDCESGSGVIDGWLRDDEYVSFRTLTGPWKMPLRWFEQCEKLSRETNLP